MRAQFRWSPQSTTVDITLLAQVKDPLARPGEASWADEPEATAVPPPATGSERSDVAPANSRNLAACFLNLDGAAKADQYRHRFFWTTMLEQLATHGGLTWKSATG